jgi:hypothetical protein
MPLYLRGSGVPVSRKVRRSGLGTEMTFVNAGLSKTMAREARPRASQGLEGVGWPSIRRMY